MRKTTRATIPPQTARLYRGVNVPRAVIRRFAREVAERFDPDKIILFGSYAYGQPHEDSDVDILVVMPARGEISQAVRIQMAVHAPFPMDLIVRTPEHLAARLAEGDSFFQEVVTKGKLLHEKKNRVVGEKSGGRSRRRKPIEPGKGASA
jgi:predicted nucleotidyltransferase